MKLERVSRLAFVLVLFALNTEAYSQSSIDKVLNEISVNNKFIVADSKLAESKKLEFKVGQSLYNPFVEITNLFGPTKDIGNQTEFKLIQSFDFPTSYSKRSTLSDLKAQQTDFEKQMYRQDILLDAKLICIELVSLNKKKALLLSRISTVETLNNLYQSKLEKGEGNILDVNKSRINLLNVKTELMIAESRVNELIQKLTEMNGGNSIVFSDTTYPSAGEIPSFVELENTIENEDFFRKSLMQEKRITQVQIELSKALSLPKFEIGYYYLGLNSQTYHGIHLGFSIPLWENNYRTDFYKSKSAFTGLEIESHRNEHFYQTKQLYGKYEVLKESLNEYKSILDSSNNRELLANALRIGELSALEYFLEENFYYSSFDKYLELEKEYHKVIAELYKFQL
jgi:cobalt-zinc-cadmium efflux system outer membrane protein